MPAQPRTIRVEFKTGKPNTEERTMFAWRDWWLATRAAIASRGELAETLTVRELHPGDQFRTQDHNDQLRVVSMFKVLDRVRLEYAVDGKPTETTWLHRDTPVIRIAKKGA